MKLAVIGVGVFAVACGGPQRAKPPAHVATAAEIVDRLNKAREALTSFTAESTMDYWVGDQRMKGTVLVMGTTGAKVRFNALSPAGGDVLVDMACNGADFALVDKQNNCQLTGPCSRDSIASLLHVELEPDDFIHLALGTPPVLANPTGTVTWDDKTGHETVKLESPDGSQTVEIDAGDGRFDVVASELRRKDGSIVWSVQNADWGNVKDAQGGDHRLPNKTRFKSPTDNSDLLVGWNERTVNVALDANKFVVSIPAGLPVCGQKPAK